MIPPDMKKSRFEIDTSADQIVDRSQVFLVHKAVQMNEENEPVSGYDLFELVRKEGQWGNEVRSVWQFEGFKEKEEIIALALEEGNDICAGYIDQETVYIGNVLEPVLKLTQEAGDKIEEELEAQ